MGALMNPTEHLDAQRRGLLADLAERGGDATTLSQLIDWHSEHGDEDTARAARWCASRNVRPGRTATGDWSLNRGLEWDEGGIHPAVFACLGGDVRRHAAATRRYYRGVEDALADLGRALAECRAAAAE